MRGQFIDRLLTRFRLVLADDAGLGQVPIGPNRAREIPRPSIAATENPRIGTLRIGDETINRAESLPGRYPAEFDALGNDSCGNGESLPEEISGEER